MAGFHFLVAAVARLRSITPLALVLVAAPSLVEAPAPGGGSGGGSTGTLAALVITLAATAATVWILRRSGGGPVVIARLFIHPVKSCAPIEVQALRLDKLGVVNDRRWAIVDMSKELNSRILTSRTHPRMALIVPALVTEEARDSQTSPLTLSAPGMPSLQVPRPRGPAEALEVSLWTIPGAALDCGDDAAKWLGEFLGQKSLRLAYLSDDSGSEGPVKFREMCKQEAWNGGNEADSVYLQGTKVGFADSTHLTLVSEASLQDLRRKLPPGQDLRASFGPERFRMNVVLAGTSAYEEEMWKSFRIGAAHFEIARLCNRCTVTIVDPASGEKGPFRGQPLEVLRSYRSKEHLWRVDPRHGTAPILGTKACTLATEGAIRVGDTVSVVALRSVGDRRY